ncbi:MAG: prepilin-type N-terminal cleavage/methylation domain-containing protein, partial [Burkholderiales bacterium]|nr:prepilin-type N-terminal cleavage/methylation domain-containing protein [Burkholderiales bacterium]
MRQRAMKNPTRRESGFTMIEVLVALLVMAFGMLGIVSLLLVSTRANTSSILKQQAVQ